MKIRIITAIILVAAGVFVIGAPSGWWVFTAAAMLTAIFGTYEIVRAAGLFRLRHIGFILPLTIVSGSMPFFARFLTEYAPDYWADGKLLFMALIGTTYAVLIFFTFSFAVAAKEPQLVGDFCVAYMGSFYITVACSMIALLRMSEFGLYMTVFMLFITIFSDTGAYFIGSKFGRHKLIPSVSPKKSVEGLIGGLIIGIVALLLYGAVVRFAFGIEVHFIQLSALALLLGAVGAMGDLIASAIKRKYGIKDYSNIFPGHGGIFDRFDSVFAVSIFLYLLTDGTELLTVFS